MRLNTGKERRGAQKVDFHLGLYGQQKQRVVRMPKRATVPTCFHQTKRSKKVYQLESVGVENA